MFKHKKKILFALIIAAIIGGIYYKNIQKPKVEYTAAEVAYGTLARTVSVTGEVVSPEEIDLSFKSAGRIETLTVDIGDRVTAKQKIATIDEGTLISQLRQAQSNVVAEKETLLNMKRGNYKVEAENAQRAEIKKAQAAVSQIYDQLKELSIYSPMEGIVTRRLFDPGENVAANSTVVTVAKEGDLEVSASVPESDIVDVKIGQNATVAMDAFLAEETLEAVVAKIDPASTVIQDVVYYKVTLKFKSLDPRLKNGMNSDVDINVQEKGNIVFAPERAVKTEGNQKYVEILKSDDTTERVNVNTGMKGDDGMIEITSGLKEGEKVVTLSKEL